MAQLTKGRIVCPKCGKEQEIEIYRSITSEDEEEKAGLLMNRIFQTKCIDCEEEIPLIYNCLYHDLQGEAMYYLLPSMEEDQVQEMNQILQEIEKQHIEIAHQNKYRYRKVLTANELREKILIAEQNLDDRIIELLKVVYLIQLSEVIGEKVISEVLFDVMDDTNYLVIFYEDQKLDPGMILPDMQIYKQLKEQYLSIIEEKMPKGFAQIDFEWAKDIIFSKK